MDCNRFCSQICCSSSDQRLTKRSNPPSHIQKKKREMSLDSEAVFNERMVALGLQEHTEKFDKLGWKTYGSLAFATSFVPGQTEDERFLKDIVEAGLGDSNHHHKGALRRLFFESYTLAAADLKRKVEVTTDDAPRKVPAAERQERRDRVAIRLVGISLRGEMDISNRLLDLAVGIYEDNTMKYVAWQDCTKREMELNGLKKDSYWAADSQGIIKEKSHTKSDPADLSSDLKVAYALRRRGLAFEMADIMSYEVHEKLVDQLLAAFMKDPLPGYARVGVNQLIRADQEAFKQLAYLTSNGIKKDGARRRPCDEGLIKILDDPDFRQALANLPGRAENKRKSDNSDSGDEKIKRRKTKAQRLSGLRSRLENVKAQYAALMGQLPAGSAAPQATSKGKGKGKSVRMPVDLIGKHSMTSDGRRICFGYNLPGGCTAAAAGKECSKGHHVCMEPGCYGPHPVHKHQ